MKSHKEMLEAYSSSLRAWQDYTRTLDHSELQPAAQYLIGAVCTMINREDLENHIRVVEAILAERRGQDDR